MGVSRVINRRTAVLGLLLVILATAGLGFAAGNTVPGSGAGDGAGSISGYDVTGIDYNLDEADPGLIEEVEFNLAAQVGGPSAVPGDVTIQLVSSGGDWYDCTTSSATVPAAYVCTVGDVTVASANQLRVIAAN